MKRYFTLILLILTVFFLFNESSFAVEKKSNIQKASVSTNANLETELYKKAEIQLDRQLYREYRIAERIIRANKLDNYPWVIEIPNSKDYVVNASTSQGNLIIIEGGTMNTFYDDVSALAFVTAHEIAHEILRHAYFKSRNDQILDKNLQDEINSAKGDIPDLINKYIILTPIMGGYGASSVVKASWDQENQKLENKKTENEYDKLAFSRKCEYEADKLALIMIIRAGFLPQNSIRVFEFLKRMPSSIDDAASHPSDENRIVQIESLIKNLDTVQLKKEGSYNIKNSKPLTYERTFYKEKDTLRKKTIVINSKYATEEVNEPFRKMFGK
jgi:predicted Zn-dependent protease